MSLLPLFASVLLASAVVHAGTVEARKAPDKPWEAFPTRTLSDLSSFRTGPAVTLTEYGGWKNPGPVEGGNPSGFFRTKKIGDRWWLIDPDGCRFLHIGVASVRPLASPGARKVFSEKFGTGEKWAAETTSWLRQRGFNGLGCWPELPVLSSVPPPPLVYTFTLNLLGGYLKKIGLKQWKQGETGDASVLPVFDEAFSAHCREEAAAKLADLREDKFLLGTYSDNEIIMPDLESSLREDASEPLRESTRREARRWLRERRGLAADAPLGSLEVSKEEQNAWAGHWFDHYYRVTTEAVRAADPNHLCLGSRLHGRPKYVREIWEAAGRHLDVVSVNYYSRWGPEPDIVRDWMKAARKPFLVTEFYVKGADSGMPNATMKAAAGWEVKTQADRGKFYENFVIALLESRGCVGWHWFRYQDEDPESTDGRKGTANKGIVSNRYEPYEPLLKSMKAVNEAAYPLAEWLDRSGGGSKP